MDTYISILFIDSSSTSDAGPVLVPCRLLPILVY